MILTRPWFSATVILTLALSIGVNTTVFTLANAALFKPIPLPGGAHLVVVREQDQKNPNNFQALSYPQFRQFQSQSRSFTALEAAGEGQAVIGENGIPPARYFMGNISTGLFAMLRIDPVVGRTFSASDGKLGSPPVALIGYSVWQNRYAGAANIVGRTVRLNGVATTLIGVMPEGFKFPTNEEVWTPIVPTKEIDDRSRRGLLLYGRLPPEFTSPRPRVT